MYLARSRASERSGASLFERNDSGFVLKFRVLHGLLEYQQVERIASSLVA